MKSLKKMGRPKIKASEKRTFIGIMIAPHIKRRVNEFAQEKGLTISSAINELLKRIFYGSSDL